MSTLFDFLMFYIKLWKIETQSCLTSKNNKEQLPLENLYNWICEIEGLAYDLSKSLLIDLRCLRFPASLSVCSLITVAILVHQKVALAPNGALDAKTIKQLKMANQCWDGILKQFFGKHCIQHIEDFGIYLYKR